MKVEFYRHHLTDDMLPELQSVLQSIFLTTGPRTEEFEQRFAEFLGVGRAVGLSSCTVGLFLCLKSWGIGPGDEVIVPAMTFVATANAVLHTGAQPVFADIDPDTGLISLKAAEKALTPRTCAIIPVHLYGQMVDMRAFRDFADKHGLYLLEDAAHCVEGSRDGIKPGQFGDAVCFSFYATKNMTCGEGGAVATNDEKLADKLKVLRLHGLDKDASKRYEHFKHYDMAELGYKYNMNDLQAVMLLKQFETVEQLHEKRKKLYRYYITKLEQAELPLRWPAVLPGADHAHHLFVVRTESSLRDKLLTYLQEKNIGIAVNYQAIHLYSYYRKYLGTGPGMCPHAEKMGKEVISLPFYPSLERQAVDYIVDVLSDFFLPQRR